jgi:hypothetical protein
MLTHASFIIYFLDDYRFEVLQKLSLTKWIFIQFLVIHDFISSQIVDERSMGFAQWMNTSIIHDNICPLNHKKRHPKTYHSDIKYHMTLNIIFSVVYGLGRLGQG